MALFNPQALFHSLVAAMGLTPEQIQGFVNDLTNELREMRADRLAFKPASIRVVNEVRSDLARIEGKLDSLIANLPPMESDHGRYEHEHVNGTSAESGSGAGQPGSG